MCEFGEKVRYLSFVPGNPGRRVAARVKFDRLPAPFDGFKGTTMWVGQPRDVSETSGDSTPTPLPAFKAAPLQCDPFYMDWGPTGTVHAYGEAIVPSLVPFFDTADYEIQVIAEGLDITVEENYTSLWQIRTSIWGDLAGSFANGRWQDPDGDVDFDDITSVVDKFRNLPTAQIKARADIAPDEPDRIVDFVDIPWVVDAFRGLQYPFRGPTACLP